MDQINQFNQWISNHRRGVAIGFCVFVALIVVYMFIFRTDGFSLTRLSIPSTNASISTDGSVLRGYNGAYFYKQDLTSDSAPKILGGGLKLPGIRDAIWAGDRGVLLNFDQSFIYTAADAIATRDKIPYEEKSGSSWYFDFSKNSLSRIDGGIIRSGLSYFDEKTGIVYYISFDDSVNFHAFNTRTAKDALIPTSIALGDVSNIVPCYNNLEKICIVGKGFDSGTTTSIYSLESASTGVLKKIYSLEGRIHPVIGTPYALLLKQEYLIKSDEERNVIGQYEKVVYKNLATGEEHNVNELLTPDNLIYTAYGEKSEKAVIINGANNGYLSAKTMPWGQQVVQSGSLNYRDGGAFDGAVVFDTTPTKNSILLKTSDDDFSILAPNGYIKAPLKRSPSAEVTKQAAVCGNTIPDVKTSFTEPINTVTFLIPDNASFTENVKKIDSCLMKSPELFYSYDFSLSAYDTVSGRVTSY